MIPWDWIGIVTIRNETFRSTLTKGTIAMRPGSFSPMTRPKRKTTPFSYCSTTCRVNERTTSTTMTTTTSATTSAVIPAPSQILNRDPGFSLPPISPGSNWAPAPRHNVVALFRREYVVEC